MEGRQMIDLHLALHWLETKIVTTLHYIFGAHTRQEKYQDEY